MLQLSSADLRFSAAAARGVLSCAAVAVWLFSGTVAWADGPADNQPDNVRRVPKLGLEVPAAARQSLEAGLTELRQLIQQLRTEKAPSPVLTQRRLELLPDVEIFARAVSDALTYQEFFVEAEFAAAQELLATGINRAQNLLRFEAPWAHQTGLIVRGYVSKIDGSVQPYGLVIPETYRFDSQSPTRLDIWFHGRGELMSEVSFLNQRMKQVGQIAPPATIVLHPYGRYSNAFKFAGEVDVLEALESVRRHYAIDDDRTTVRGFSMGGAGCWQFAVHYADRWAAAAPGAGFSETPEFLRTYQQETLNPTSIEKRLWHWYDCTDYAINLSQCPTVAYSGELDSQKQAADIMQTALARDGIDLVHLIGPQTKHAYHPVTALEIERRISSIAERGRNRFPAQVQFTTYTLKYNRMHWLTIDGLGEHWNKAHVQAGIEQPSRVQVTTENVTGLTLDFPAGRAPFDLFKPVKIVIDGQRLDGPKPGSDLSWHVVLERPEGSWRVAQPAAAEAERPLVKRQNLQGPIDDAFMDSFIFVRPTGRAAHPQVQKWAESELERAIEHWRRHFRGHARVMDDTAVTDAEIKSANLVLWGDPSSNAVLKQIADKLPIRWGAEKIEAGTQSFSAAEHALIAVYPNPLNRDRYVVLNSSFTFRDYAYLNNARQVPMLPDWAIVGLRTPPGSQYPGKIVAADFFDEHWQLKAAGK